MSEVVLERGDGPARAVLRANAEQQALRQAIETQEELQKIKDRVCVTLSAYEIGEEIREVSENNVEEMKVAFVKDEAELEFVDDMAKLYLILSDPIAKRKYQQKVTIFVVGYENLCDNRNKLLSQIQEFFNQSAQDDNAFVVDVPEFDFEEVEKNVRDALDKAEKTTERLASVSQEVMKIFELVNPKDHKKGKKKLEKALYQSQQDVMTLTEKLVGVQTDLEDAKNKLEGLNKQLEIKEVDIERLKLQVNTNKSFAAQCNDLKKALEAKEHQLQNYVTQMDELELTLSQAEGKYDNYVEKNKKLKEENEKLLEEVQRKTKEHQQKIIDTRKELELKYDEQVKEVKQNNEDLVTRLKDVHEEEIKNLREKIDLMRKPSSVSTTVTTPASRDSAVTRYSSVATTDYSATTLSMKQAVRVVKTLTDLKGSATTSRLDTASSQVSVNQETDSALETSRTLFVSMSNTPSTPRTAETTRNLETRDASARMKTTEISTQTDIIVEDEEFEDESDGKSRHELEEIELELSTTPSEELPGKMDEYKNKLMEVQREMQEEIVQWKLRFNTKSQALNQLFSTHENQVKEKERILGELSTVQEQLVQAEKEAEEAILQLEELKAENEEVAIKELRPEKEEITDATEVLSMTDQVDTATKPEQVLTENRSTATSASLLRSVEKDEVTTEDRLQSPGNLFDQQSVAVQCPSASRSTMSPQLSEVSIGDGEILIQPSDSGFEEGGQASLPKSPDVLQEESTSQTDDKEYLKPSRTPSPRVRSRLVRSALKEHSVISETIKTFEMITEFKINITYWLEQNGFKSDLFVDLPEFSFDKSDELDVLKNIPLIRDQTKQILDALWQITAGEYSMIADDDHHGDQTDDTRGNSVCDVYDVDAIASGDGRLSSSPVARQQKSPEERPVRVASVPSIRARSVQTSSLFNPTPRTTPKGYTQLLHEYNNLNETHMKLEQELQDNLKKYQEETSQNAAVMNEMQETINNLRWQLLENGSPAKQEMVSSVMFTRLDAERNVKSMKRAMQGRRLSQSSFDDVVSKMNLYVDLPGRRLAELVKRYHHHCIMKEVEDNLYPPVQTDTEVYNVQERMEELQKRRAEKWSERMNEMSKRRSVLSDEITSSLKEIEDSSGIFLIKPLYSYSSRPQLVQKSHPIICKRREVPKKVKDVPSNNVQPRTANMANGGQNISSRPTWNFQDSLVSGPPTVYDNITIPRLLAMDVNRIMLSKNPVSVYVNPKSSNDNNVTLTAGVRQYITVERPIGVMTKAHLNGDSETFPATTNQSQLVSSRTPSPSLSQYPPLPPINLQNIANHQSATSRTTRQSMSSLSLTSFDETFARYHVER